MATFGTSEPGLTTAQNSAAELAHEQTARIEIISLKKTDSAIEATVRVTNDAGHFFPTGVSFRRAFLQFELKDSHGTPLWASGATDRWGAISQGVNGPILPTEFLERDANGKQQYQPHYQVISEESQVQIYEELVKNPEGQFTTSFLALADKIKQNRLQPRNWRASGPHGDVTKPVGEAANDDDYKNGCGCDTILYRIPLNDKTRNAATAKASIYYQTTPPYYLRQRFTDSTMSDTQRLMSYVARLNVAGTAIRNWKLLVKETAPVPVP
jgi:hypothetical protein